MACDDCNKSRIRVLIRKIGSPKPQRVAAEQAPAAKIDQLAKDRERRVARELGKFGAAGSKIDRCAREHQLGDLVGKTRRVDQRHPSALTQAEEVDAAAQLIHHNVEVGKIT